MRLAFATGLVIALACPALAQSQAPLSTKSPQARQPVSEQEWITFVRGKLNRFAPRAYQRGRREGIVGRYELSIAFSVQPDGSPTDIRISNSSGNKAADEVGMRVPTLAAPFPAFTSDMAKAPKKIVAPFVFDFVPIEPVKTTEP